VLNILVPITPSSFLYDEVDGERTEKDAKGNTIIVYDRTLKTTIVEANLIHEYFKKINFINTLN
jgi:hypothetical protein